MVQPPDVDLPSVPHPIVPPSAVQPPSGPPSINPPLTQPPATNPPLTQPPVTKPPLTQPPATKPPLTQPPVTEPPLTQPPTTKPPLTVPPSLIGPATNRIAQALLNGDSSQLQEADRLPLLQGAAQIMNSTRTQQTKLVAQLLDDSTAASVNYDQNSQSISPFLASSASPLLVANNGNNVLASISRSQGGRALGYGKDLLSQLSTSSGGNQEQWPLFQRSFTWLVTGDAAKPLPASVRVATAAYPSGTVNNLFKRLGSKAEMVTCAITDASNSCWQDADVFIFGQGTPNTPGLDKLVGRYLQAGKGVIYLHDNWSNNTPGSRQVLQATGMQLGGDSGNWYSGVDSYQISGKTAAQQRDAADRLGWHEAVLSALLNGSTANLATDTSLVQALDGIRNDLLTMEHQGIDLFADDYLQKPDTLAHRRLVLWADMARKQVDYSLVRRANTNETLRTLAADSLSYAVRSSEAVPKNFADWMPTASPNLATSQAWETIDVTIGQGSGYTAIGRGAVPGKAVQVEIVDPAGTNLALRVGYIRTRGNPLGQENYTRPRFPDGHEAVLNPNKALTYTTAWGGPLFLRYTNATPGSVVKLRVRGSVKYAHFDFTRNPSNQEIDEAVLALQRGDFGWQTSKMVGGEVQQTIDRAQSAVGNYPPKVYVVDRLKGMIFDSNHIANGYNNIAPTANVNTVCATLGWDCTSDIHRAPGVQHFVGWLAQCGWLCSGNPSDGGASVEPGWGWWHELGHNTVPRHMRQLTEQKDSGCVVECDNNILASASALRQYAITNGAENNDGSWTDHRKLYKDIEDSRATDKTGEELRQDMYDRFWTGPLKSYGGMRAVHFQLGFIYTRERLNQAKPLPADVIDFLSLVTRGERLIYNSDYWKAHKNALGMDSYAESKISNNDLLYVLSSMVIGRDMRQLFASYGIPLSAQALSSIVAHGLPQLSPEFYAMPINEGNKLELGQWLSLANGMPVYPFSAAKVMSNKQ